MYYLSHIFFIESWIYMYIYMNQALYKIQIWKNVAKIWLKVCDIKICLNKQVWSVELHLNRTPENSSWYNFQVSQNWYIYMLEYRLDHFRPCPYMSLTINTTRFSIPRGVLGMHNNLPVTSCWQTSTSINYMTTVWHSMKYAHKATTLPFYIASLINYVPVIGMIWNKYMSSIINRYFWLINNEL